MKSLSKELEKSELRNPMDVIKLCIHKRQHQQVYTQEPLHGHQRFCLWEQL